MASPSPSSSRPLPRRSNGAARPPAATRMSGRKVGNRGWIGALRLAGRLARASLLLGPLTMIAASCLVTSTPEFKPSERTAPNLIARTADPDPRKIVGFLAGENELVFRVDVDSEDDGQPLQVHVLIDYGVWNELQGTPFQDDEDETPVPAGSLGDEGRTAQVRVTSDRIDAGCHTVTLMVAHEFHPNGCPTELADSDQITWIVYRCAPGPCPPPFDPLIDCAPVTTSCPAQASLLETVEGS